MTQKSGAKVPEKCRELALRTGAGNSEQQQAVLLEGRMNADMLHLALIVVA